MRNSFRLVEAAFPDTRVHVRGNEVVVDGPAADRVARLVEELVLLAERGQRLDAPLVARTIDMVRADERPSEVLTAEVLRARTADDEPADALVERWTQRWDTAQRRAAAQLAELAAGEAHELAELVVAVRTLRGLRAR